MNQTLSQLLTILIATAEDMIVRPQRMPAAMPAALASLAEDIRRFDRRPAEGVRCTSAALMMLLAMEEFFGAESRDKSSSWLMLAGATLPLVRTAAWVALNQEREAAQS